MVATVETGSFTDADIAGRLTSHLVAWVLLGSTPRTWVLGKVTLRIQTHAFMLPKQVLVPRTTSLAAEQFGMSWFWGAVIY